MVESMKRVASLDQELSVEERNLLSVAYKNVIGARRAAWRIISSLLQKEEAKGNAQTKLAQLDEYKRSVRETLIYRTRSAALMHSQPLQVPTYPTTMSAHTHCYLDNRTCETHSGSLYFKRLVALEMEVHWPKHSYCFSV